LAGSKVGGRNLSDDVRLVGTREVCAVPLRSAVEMDVKKTGFFGQLGEERVFLQNLVQPAGSSTRRTDDEK
jgi:hypothetical protein